MHGWARRSGATFFSIATLAAVSPAVWCAALASAPATAPATSTRAANELPDIPTPTAGKAISVDDLLTWYGIEFGVIIVKDKPLADKVTPQAAIPENRDQALAVLNDLLGQRNLVASRVQKGSGGSGDTKSGSDYGDRVILQIVAAKDAPKTKVAQDAHVTSGHDPAVIDMSQRDRLITHMLPVQNAELLQTLQKRLGEDKDVKVATLGNANDGYTLVLSGPADVIKHAVTLAAAIDTKPDPPAPPVTRTIKLENLDATQAAESVNSLYGPNVQGGQAAHAEPDKRTNTVLITGSESSVFAAVVMLQRIDRDTPPPQPFNLNAIPKGGEVPPRNPLLNRRGGMLMPKHPDSLNESGGLYLTMKPSGAASGATASTITNESVEPGTGGKMKFNFINAQVDTVLAAMAETYGFMIIKSQPIGSTISLYSRGVELDAAQAISLISDVLLPLGYGVLETHTPAPTNLTILRIVTVQQLKRAQIPVISESDPNKIELTDRIITDVIKLKNLDATSLRSDLSPLVGGRDISVEAATNSIIITDSSAFIHRLAEIIQALDDKPVVQKISQQKLVLKTLKAQDAAAAVNKFYNPVNTDPGDGRSGAGSFLPPPSRGPVDHTPKIYADYDTRTNAIVVEGPAEDVKKIMDFLDNLDKYPLDNDPYKPLKDAQSISLDGPLAAPDNARLAFDLLRIAPERFFTTGMSDGTAVDLDTYHFVPRPLQGVPMVTLARRSGALTISALLSLAVAGAVFGQASNPATNPATGAATTRAATTQAATAIGPASTQAIAPGTNVEPGVGGKMRFNFVNAQVDTVLTAMSETYGFIIIKTQPIGGTITAYSRGQELDAEQAIALINDILYPIGYGVLETRTTPPNNLTILRIATIQEVKRAQIPVFYKSNPADIELSDRIITNVIALKNLDAVGLRSDLSPLLSADADVAANSASNTIIITDTSAKIHRVAEIIQMLDSKTDIQKITQQKQVLKYSSAQDAARLLNNLYNPTNTQPAGGAAGGGAGGGLGGLLGGGGAGGRGGAAGGRGGAAGGGGGGTARTPRLYADYDTRTNTIVVEGPQDTVNEAMTLLADLDKDPVSDSVLFIYPLKNAQASDLEYVLNRVFGSGSTTTAGNRNTTTGTRSGSSSSFGSSNSGGDASNRTSGGFGASANPIPDGTVYTAAGGGGGGGGGRGGGGGGTGSGGFGGGGGTGGNFGSGTGTGNRGNTGNTGNRGGTSGNSAFNGDVTVVANTDTNSLLVTTSTKLESQVRAILEQLDRPVPQVLIKVLIAEVTHNNGDDIGFEFGANNLRVSNFGITAGSDFGLKSSPGGLVIGLAESQITATLKALANQNKLDVLSRPYILSQDNQEAYMIIGQEVPYITNSTTNTVGNIVNTVAYREIGIILDVIPHINPDGLVTLDVAPQVSQLDPGTGIVVTQGVTAPTFTIRQAVSRVAIKNGETIVIGGLMQDTMTQQIQKVPFLGDIPYVGMLFKRTVSNKQKTELLIFLTPHVALAPDVLIEMSHAETDNLKLINGAVHSGAFEDQMKGMEQGTVTTQPQQSFRLEGGSIHK